MTDTDNDISFWNDSGLPDDVVRLLSGCSIVERRNTREVLLVGGGLGMPPCVVVRDGHMTLDGVHARLQSLGFDLSHAQLQKVGVYIRKLRVNERRYSKEPSGASFTQSWRTGEHYFEF